MKKSLYELEKISQSLNTHEVYYKFNKDLEASDKYRKGRVNELIYYFVQKENKFIDEFKDHIQDKKKTLLDLKEGDFKQGLYDELNIIEDMLNARNDNRNI